MDSYLFNFSIPVTHLVFYKQKRPHNYLVASNLNSLCEYCSSPTYPWNIKPRCNSWTSWAVSNHNYRLPDVRNLPAFQPERLWTLFCSACSSSCKIYIETWVSSHCADWVFCHQNQELVVSKPFLAESPGHRFLSTWYGQYAFEKLPL